MEEKLEAMSYGILLKIVRHSILQRKILDPHCRPQKHLHQNLADTILAKDVSAEMGLWNISISFELFTCLFKNLSCVFVFDVQYLGYS